MKITKIIPIWLFLKFLYDKLVIAILGLQPIPGDPKRQWHGGHVGWQNKTFCHPTWLPHHCLLDLQGLVANQELGVEQLRFQLVLVKSLTINKEKIKKSFLWTEGSCSQNKLRQKLSEVLNCCFICREFSFYNFRSTSIYSNILVVQGLTFTFPSFMHCWF